MSRSIKSAPIKNPQTLTLLPAPPYLSEISRIFFFDHLTKNHSKPPSLKRYHHNHQSILHILNLNAVIRAHAFLLIATTLTQTHKRGFALSLFALFAFLAPRSSPLYRSKYHRKLARGYNFLLNQNQRHSPTPTLYSVAF